jgi:DNA-binding transcriptional MerR regulator
MNLAELAERSGVPARTIRFYIARGVVPGPAGAGRAAHYTEEHLAHLRRVKQLQAQGRMLVEIAREVEPAKVPLPSPSTWWSYPLADDVVVQVRAGATPWRLRQIRRALERLAAELRKEPEE